MKRSDAKKAMPHLIDKWIKASNNEKTPPNKLVDAEFISWLAENYLEYLNFKTFNSVIFDIEMWFNEYIKAKIRFINDQLMRKR
jgi:hypothetical protein